MKNTATQNVDTPLRNLHSSLFGTVRSQRHGKGVCVRTCIIRNINRTTTWASQMIEVSYVVLRHRMAHNSTIACHKMAPELIKGAHAFLTSDFYNRHTLHASLVILSHRKQRPWSTCVGYFPLRNSRGYVCFLVGNVTQQLQTRRGRSEDPEAGRLALQSAAARRTSQTERYRRAVPQPSETRL